MHALLSSAGTLLNRLCGDRRGSMIAFVAIAAVPMIGFIGIGSDTARGYMVKSRLSSALDAAGLAGGKAFFLDTRDADIAMFFEANFPPGYLGATVVGPDIVVDEEDETIHLYAEATIETAFMHLIGFPTLTVSSEAEVTRKMIALDVTLAIDMSGSMDSQVSGGTRLDAARTAANDLVDILFGEDSTKEFLKIGLVPWGAKVNVMENDTAFDAAATISQAVTTFTNPITGALQTEVYFANNSPVPLLSAPPADWQGCVYNRYIDDTDDDNDGDVMLGEGAFGVSEWMAWEPVGPEGEPQNPGRCALGAPFNRECTPCGRRGITPLVSTKSVIRDAINQLTNANGNTNIPAGLAWAWRVLMPESPFTEADPDPEIARQQAIVLLTDGENWAGFGDGYKTVFGYGSGGRPEMDERLRALADNIKASGVLIYTIQFAHSGTSLQALMKDVASGPNAPYYHFAPDRDDLRRIFREIANHLSELRLSK